MVVGGAVRGLGDRDIATQASRSFAASTSDNELCGFGSDDGGLLDF